MAFAYVQSAYHSSNSATSSPVTLTGVTVGNILVSFFYSRDTPNVTGNPADSQGFTHVVSGGGWSVAWGYYKVATATSESATYTLSNPKRVRSCLVEYSYDTAKTLVLETDTHLGGNPMDDTADLITTTNSTCLVVSGVGYWGGASMTDANGGTRRTNQNDSNASFAFGDRMPGATGDYGFDWQQSGTTGLQFAFSEQAAGASGKPWYQRAQQRVVA